jgi:anaerobic selenocysteine-containing dehydrogenase
MEIFLDYARRMDLRDRDGRPLPGWSTPEDAFDAWKACSKGRPCDYSGLSYEKLRGGSGIPWPLTDDAPEGTERLYSDGRFPTEPDVAEDYGHDLVTGKPNEEKDFRALEAGGRAILKAAHYSPPDETPDDEYPLRLSTGRTVYHFHTRTKTGRARELNAAAPDAWVELAPTDARRLGIAEGDWVRLESPRGRLETRARLTAIREGVVFAPFHYGYWDQDAAENGRPRAANELTPTDLDPVSKQPVYKVAAVRVERLAAGDGPAPAPTKTASQPAGRR